MSNALSFDTPRFTVTHVLGDVAVQSATIAFEDTTVSATIAASGGVDNKTTSTTVVLASSMANLNQSEYIKSESGEYMKVTAIAGDGVTLTVERAASPPGLTAGSIAVVANASSVTLVEGGVDATESTVKLASAIDNLDVGEYIKTAAGEYMQVTSLSDDGKTVNVTRGAAPAGLTQGAAAEAAAGTLVILAEGLVEMGASTPGNVPAMTPSLLVLIGSGFESFEVTTRARAGETSCELTLWDSTTSLQCKSARGSHRTRHATITAGIRSGTTTDAVSHDQASLSLVHGPPFTSVIGTCDGTCTCDDAGVPSCDGTGTCTCTPPYTPVVGTCDGTCTCTTAGTPTCSGTGTCLCHLYPPSTNTPAATSVLVTIHGSSMGSELSTTKARTGGSACESTLWRGTGWVVCKVAQAGHAKTMGLAITVNIGPGIPGTVTEALSFDNPQVVSVGHPLWGFENCIITPHIGNTPEMGLPLLAQRVSDNVRRRIAGSPLIGPVDVDQGY